MLLRKLDVTDCLKITRMSLSPLRDSAHLETLILSGCTRVKGYEYCGRRLEVLDFSRLDQIDDLTLTLIAQASRRLRAVRLTHCAKIRRPKTFA